MEKILINVFEVTNIKIFQKRQNFSMKSYAFIIIIVIYLIFTLGQTINYNVNDPLVVPSLKHKCKL